MSSEVEETLKRLVGHKGVIGTIVVNSDGIVSSGNAISRHTAAHTYFGHQDNDIISPL